MADQHKHASGVGAPKGSQVHFTNINGDGFEDYMVVNLTDGTVTAWMNGGQKYNED